MKNADLIEHFNQHDGSIEKIELAMIVLNTQNLRNDITEITFSNCIIKELHLFTETTRDLKLKFYECTIEQLSVESKFNHDIELWDSIVNRLNLYECTSKSLTIHKSTIEYLHSESPNLGEILLHTATVIRLSLFSVLTQFNLRINKSIVKELSLEECKKEATISIAHSQVAKVVSSKSPIASLGLRDNTSPNSVFIAGSSLKELRIRDYTNLVSDSIILTDVSVDVIRIERYAGQGEFDLLNCWISEIKFTDSVIAKGKANSVNLSKSRVINFSRSNITNWAMFNITWSKDYQLTEYEIKNEQTPRSTWEVMETYRQLKSIYQRQNNYIEASQFSRHELRMFYRIVHYKILNWRLMHLGNFLLLGSSKHLSNFGQSILRPLLGLFGVHALLFTGLLMTFTDLPVQIVDCSEHDWSAFWRGLDLYSYTLLPTHSSNIDNVPIWGTIDVAMRISAGYFIYYFLRATRKFHAT